MIPSQYFNSLMIKEFSTKEEIRLKDFESHMSSDFEVVNSSHYDPNDLSIPGGGVTVLAKNASNSSNFTIANYDEYETLCE